MRNHPHLALPIVRLVLGICAIVLSLIFSIEFVSNGAAGIAVLGAVIFCLITEACKVFFTGDLFFYAETEQHSKVFFNAIVVAVLFALSISAAVFSLTIAPTREQAMISDFDGKVSRLEQAISDKKEQLAACNPSHVSKCVNPRTQELTGLENELSKLTAANNELLAAKTSRAFWQKIADYTGSTPDNLQLNFAVARAVLLDLLGLVLISQYTTAKRMETINGQFQRIETPVNGNALNEDVANQALLERMHLLKQIEDLKAALSAKELAKEL